VVRPTLADVEELARGAGEILREGFGKRHQVRYKGAIDLVTEVDHDSEAYLLSEIQRRFPEHQVVSEESEGRGGAECCRWIIDPIDGTVNYAHGVPIFSVSVAYQEQGVVMLGAVYEPMRNECFSAERGRGAFLNGEAVQASTASQVNRSLLVTGFSYDIRTNPVNNLAEYAYFALHSQGVRRLGSAALDLCYVAAGRFDGYWELEIKAWDVAAGGLIAEQAGAMVSNIQGEADYLKPPCSILATCPGIYDEMLKTLGEIEKQRKPIG
jgi:myo-inositol-1(or 4)-monophosphatase